MKDSAKQATNHQKMLWFVALYLGGVIAVAGLSYALRLLVI